MSKALKNKIKMEYDAVKNTTARRRPVIEYKNEDQILDSQKRALIANFCRDLERNYSPAKGILQQFRMNVVGDLGKIQVNIEGGEEAASFFNQEWAKNCDFRDDIHFSQILQNVVAGVLREGDLLVVVDDGLIEDSGKLLHWEADQIVNVSDEIFERKIKKELGGGAAVQENGIVRDKWGRVLGYIVTGKRGLRVVDKEEDVTVWKRENARLIKNPWRLNQGRGVPALITSATNFLDLYEILTAELLSAKRQAVIAGYTKRSNAVTDWDNPTTGASALPENTGKNETTIANEIAGGGTAPNYERFEALTGGIWEYVDAQDEIVFPDLKRPSVQIATFIESVLCYAGASLGLAKAYSLLRADSSYTAFRGDMIMSWQSAFYPMQKWLERCYCDWVAVKVLTWAQNKRIISKLPAGWEKTISWKFPIMPHVDEAREAQAITEALKTGTIDYSEIMGPDWQKKFEALSKQLEKAKELGLPLNIFETKSGGVMSIGGDNNATG